VNVYAQERPLPNQKVEQGPPKTPTSTPDGGENIMVAGRIVVFNE
jgi:hypothetical protein